MTAAASATAVVALLAACGTEGGSDRVGSPATSETAAPAEPTPDGPSGTGPRGGPAFPDSTAPQLGWHSRHALLVLTDVRVADRGSFDRIVLEFSGAGTPGWAVNYVDKAVLDGSGEAVAVDGDAVLDVYASGTTAPAPDYYGGPRHVRPRGGGGVVDVYVGGTFEATTQVLAGIDGARVPFRVFALTEPARLVVDVRDVGAG